MKRLTIKDLKPGTNYVVQIRAKNETEVGEWSKKFNFTTTSDNVAPNAPTNVTWVAAGDSYYATWDAVTNNVDTSEADIVSYEMTITFGATSKVVSINPISGTTQSYALSYSKAAALFNNAAPSPLKFKVRARNSIGIYSAFSTELTANFSVPGVPQNAVVVPFENLLKISWDAPASGVIEGYRVYVSDVSASFTPTIANMVYQGEARTFSLAAYGGATQYIKITAYNKFGEGPALSATGAPLIPDAEDFTPPATVSGSVTTSFDTARGESSLNMTWTGISDPGLQSYNVRYGPSSSGPWNYIVTDKSATSASAVVTQNKTYYVQIAAVDRAGNVGTYASMTGSPILSAKDTTPPAQVTGLSVTPQGTAFVATWTALTDADLDSYEVGIVYSGGTEVFYKTDVPRFDFSFEMNKGSFAGTPRPALSFRVRGVDTAGNGGAWSTTVNATNAVPSAPTSLVTSTGANSITLKWTAPADTDLLRYNVYQGTSANPTTKVAEVNGTSYTTTSDATQQFFTIKAVDVFLQESAGLNSAGITATNPFLVDTTAPSTPTALAATITNNPNGIGATANVTWTNGAETDRAGIEVSYKRNADTVWNSVFYGKDQTSGIIELNYAYTAYDFRIRAYDSSANYSPWSTTLNKAAVAAGTPSVPTGFTSTAGKDSIVYSWNAVSDTDIKNYEVTFSTSSTFASGNTTYLTGTATTLTVGGLNTNTTYYARVRATNTGGLSSAFTATDTETTGTYPQSSLSDGQVPGTAPTPTVVGGLGYLYVTWSPVTLNALGAAQTDAVTYEVHLSTTSGFTPAAGTKSSEVSGTATIIDVLPGTTTSLTYGTTYYVKLIAKDRDGSGAAGAQGSGTPSQVASGDVISIGANLIVPGTGIINNLIINTGGGIQSSNYSANSAGWRIAPSGAEFNDSGSTIKADAIKAGTLGGAGGSGVINIAAGTSLVLNGGYIRSNTYTYPGQSGGTYVYNAGATAGFYLGNDGLVIAQGAVKASTLTTGDVSSASITLSGTGEIKTTGYNGTSGFRLSSSGLEVPDGSISSAKLSIGTVGGNNLWTNSSFEKDTNGSGAGYFDGWNVYSNDSAATASRVTGRTGGYAVRIGWSTASAQPQGLFRTVPGGFKTGVPYSLSWWAKGEGNAIGRICTLHNNAPSPTGVTWRSNPPLSANWQRYAVSFYRTDTTDAIFFANQAGAAAGTNAIIFDDVQIEESEFPSAYSMQASENLIGYTTIDGGTIKTGSIQSTSTTASRVWDGTANAFVSVAQPTWSINTGGNATFYHAQIRGDLVIGNSGDADTAQGVIRSQNWSYTNPTTFTGWMIEGNGDSFFNNVTAKGKILATSGDISGDLTITSPGRLLVNGTTGARIEVSSTLLRAFNTSGVESVRIDGTTGDFKAGGLTANASGVTLASGSLTLNGTGNLNVNGGNITVTSGYIRGGGNTSTTYGSASGSGYFMDQNGLYIGSNGSISASTITSGTFTSSNYITVNGTSYPAWRINFAGGAELTGATIRGNVVIGVSTSDTDSVIRSQNWTSSASTTGWGIRADGNAWFNNITIGGNSTFNGTVTANSSSTFNGNITSTATITGATITNGSIEISGGRVRVISGSEVGYLGLSSSSVALVSSGGQSIRMGNDGIAYVNAGNTSATYNRLGNYAYINRLSCGGAADPNTLGLDVGLAGARISGGLNMDSSGISNCTNVNNTTGEVKFNVSGGLLKISGAGNISGRIGMDSSGSAVGFAPTWVAATQYAMNAATPNNTNTVDFYCKDITRVNNNAYSDRRIKQNIKNIDIENSINIIKNISIKTFEFISRPGETRVGVIAQEVEEIAPGVVSETGDGTKLVNYEELHSLNIAATQELFKENEKLKDRISALESLVEQLLDNK